MAVGGGSGKLSEVSTAAFGQPPPPLGASVCAVPRCAALPAPVQQRSVAHPHPSPQAGCWPARAGLASPLHSSPLTSLPRSRTPPLRPPGDGLRCRCRTLSLLRTQRRCGRRWLMWPPPCSRWRPPRRPPTLAARPWFCTGEAGRGCAWSRPGGAARRCRPTALPAPPFLPPSLPASSKPRGCANTAVRMPCMLSPATAHAHPCAARACSRSAPGPRPTIITPHGGPHTAYSAQFFMPLTYLVSLGENGCCPCSWVW